MQIFVPYADPKQVAQILDRVRLHKQVLEANHIMDCILMYQKSGDSKHLKHPVMKMYKDHLDWLVYYTEVLNRFRIYRDASTFLDLKEPERPIFLSYAPLLDCHKKRLFQKGKKDQLRRNLPNNHYEIFKPFDSDNEDNLYVVDNIVYRYSNGKCISMYALFRDGLKSDDFIDLDTYIQIDGTQQELNLSFRNEKVGVLSEES